MSEKDNGSVAFAEERAVEWMARAFFRADKISSRCALDTCLDLSTEVKKHLSARHWKTIQVNHKDPT